MKRKKLTIALVASTVAALMLVATLSVYAYFTTRVYVYTDAGKEIAHVGMNLQLLFGKLENVTAGTDLKIPSYNVVNANGTVVTLTNQNTAATSSDGGAYWATTTAGTGQYLHYNDGVSTGQLTAYDPDAPWGSAQNPYVISETRHLQNLSALQSVGYFDMLYIGDNFVNGEYQAGSASIPYFVICNTDGTPVTIDGSGLEDPIKPIGSAEHPFIGVIGGAFVNTKTETNDNTTTTVQLTTNVAGKTSSVSTVHGFKIQTNTNQTDVGLFGYVGFLGVEPTAAQLQAEMNKSNTYVPAFEGVFSSIQNMLISDVSVTVASPDLGEKISALFEPFWKAFFANQKDADGNLILHRFTFSDKESPIANPQTVPHETHHIGIFAGHVSYAMIDQINVYYSNETTHAIDVTGTSADDNYYSASGILGMMYNMNCTVENQATTANNTTTFSGNCRVLLGTGTSGDEVGSGGEGTGTGGGALSGNGRGYVTASEIFSDFNNVEVRDDPNNELLWEYLPQGAAASSRVSGAILILKNGTSYTLADGKTAATVNGNSVSATVNGATASWTKFFIRETYTTESGEQRFRYLSQNGTTPVVEYELLGNKYNGQTIWKFSAGGNGIWHYGIRVIQNGTTFKLENGTTVTFDKVNNRITDGTNVWKNFFISNETSGAEIPHYMYDPATGKDLTVSVFERKPMTLIEAFRVVDPETGAKENLCIEWENTFLGTTTKMGLYYFYDGVFTFGLSSPEDTIRDTWQNNEVPKLHLGSTEAENWEVQATDNEAVVAFLKPITSNQELATAIGNHRQIYITAQPDTGTEGDVFMMSLVNTNGGTDITPITSGKLNFNADISEKVYKAYTEDGYDTLPQVPNKTETGGYAVMDLSIAELVEEYWGEGTTNKVMYIGRASEGTDITAVRQNYNIIPDDVPNTFYYFRASDGLPVTPNNNGTIPLYEEFTNGYFFYRQTGASGIIGSARYTFYFMNPDGTVVELRSGLGNGILTTSVQEYINSALDAAGNSSGGSNAPLYTYEDQGISIPVPIINIENSTFHNENAVAVINGTVVARQRTGQDSTKAYYYWDSTDGELYSANGTLLETAPADSERLNRYPAYIFSDYSGDSYLRIIRHYTGQSWIGNSGQDFSIWAGTNSQIEALEYHRNDSEHGVLVFNDAGYCNIRYAISGNGFNASRYVSGEYNSSDGTVTFSDADNNAGISTRLYVYSIEGVLDMDYGASKFVPKDDYTGQTHELPANSVVLWPQQSLKAQHTIPDANGVNQTYQAGTYSNLGPFDTTKVQTLVNTNYDAADDVSPDPVYSIIHLTGTGGLNWGTANGYKLGDYGLDKKFQLADQTGFGTMINLNDIFGFDLGNIPIGESNTMIAPVGSNGVEANVPKGCVAFRVNAGGKQSIRVIVAVPTTDKYLNEQGFELDMLKDYYIGVWQVEASGESIAQSFDKADALEKFELPRSHMFNAESTPTAADNQATAANATYKNYVNVQYQGQNYRTYLNGDCFLVGYEFTVYGEGVYVIGSVHGSSNTDRTKDIPMEIVHFSVSSTASAGRDGVTGNQLGAIDFVYDDAESADDTSVNIVTIDKTGSQTGPNNGTEYYSNYYASQCLLYSNNEQKDSSGNYLLLNKEKVWIRRYVDNSTPNSAKTIMAYQVTGDVPDSFLVKQYAINSDTVEKNE